MVSTDLIWFHRVCSCSKENHIDSAIYECLGANFSLVFKKITRVALIVSRPSMSSITLLIMTTCSTGILHTFEGYGESFYGFGFAETKRNK